MTSARPASRSGRSARAIRSRRGGGAARWARRPGLRLGALGVQRDRRHAITSPTGGRRGTVQTRGGAWTPPVCRRYGQPPVLRGPQIRVPPLPRRPISATFGAEPSVLSEPETRYVKSGDAHIAYQVVGDAPVDLIVVARLHLPSRGGVGIAGARGLLSALGVVLPVDPVRQARHRSRRPGARGRPADARAVDGRRARRDGGRRVRPGGAPRRVRGRPDVPAVRSHLSGAHAGAAALGLLRSLRLATELHRALLGRRHGGGGARSPRARVGRRWRPGGDGSVGGGGRRGPTRLGTGTAPGGDAHRSPRAAADDARRGRATAAAGDPGPGRDPSSSRRGGGRRLALPVHGRAHSRRALSRVARLRSPALDR